MEIVINGEKYPIRFGVKFEIEYEKEFKHTLGTKDGLTTAETMKMYWIAINLACKKAGKEWKLTVDDLIDYADDNPDLLKDLAGHFREAYFSPKP